MRTVWLVFLLCWQPFLAAQDSLRFSVSFDGKYSRGAKSGDLYLILARDAVGEPRFALDEFPMDGYVFRVPVVRWKMGDAIIIDDTTDGFPGSLSTLPVGRYAVQAVLDVHPTDCDFVRAPGNGRSKTIRPLVDVSAGGEIKVTVNTEITRNKARDVSRVQYRRLELRGLGRVVGHRFFTEVAIAVPASYGGENKRDYPVQWWICDLGRSSRSALKFFQQRGVFDPPRQPGKINTEFIRVLVGSHGRRGHLGWIDSQNNGPAMRSFVDEIMPAIENEFRIKKGPEDNFLIGHGLGGLSALWLQAGHPELFGGVWALAPDPVDFSDFFGVDIYAQPPQSLYRNTEGVPRPLARLNGRVAIGLETEVSYEQVVGTGNLIQSYEAMLSPVGSDGNPKPLFDRTSGTIDAKVAEYWKRGDLHQHLKTHWRDIGAALDGKIHILVGDQDNYYLHRGALKLKQTLSGLKAKASIEVIPGLDHGDLDSEAIHARVQKEIAKATRQHQE